VELDRSKSPLHTMAYEVSFKHVKNFWKQYEKLYSLSCVWEMMRSRGTISAVLLSGRNKLYEKEDLKLI